MRNDFRCDELFSADKNSREYQDERGDNRYRKFFAENQRRNKNRKYRHEVRKICRARRVRGLFQRKCPRQVSDRVNEHAEPQQAEKLPRVR